MYIVFLIDNLFFINHDIDFLGIRILYTIIYLIMFLYQKTCPPNSINYTNKIIYNYHYHIQFAHLLLKQA